MATIRKRGDFQWQVQIRKQGYPLQSRTFNTKADAATWARMIESEMERGIWVNRSESEGTTLGQCLDRYEAEITPSKKGADAERSKIKIFRQSALAARFMSNIRGRDVAEWRDERLKLVTPPTVNRELAVLSHLFNVARREWQMENLANPIEAIRRPKQCPGRDRRLFSGELNRLIAATQSPDLATILLLTLETAMRRGELISLRWENINLKKRFLILLDTKNGESRAVPLSSQAVALVESLPHRIDGKVFAMRADSITQAFTRCLERARTAYENECQKENIKPDKKILVDLRFHDLRHEATSRFFEIGLNPMEAASITGHKTLQMLKRYTHLKAEDLAKKLG